MSEEYWIRRLGAASAATTPTGQTPAFGMVYDLASGQWEDQSQYVSFVRDATNIARKEEIEQLEAAQVKKLHERALEQAQRIQDGQVGNEGDTTFEKVGGFLKHLFKEPARLVSEISDDPDDLFAKYTKKGGLLTEQEFKQFDHYTQSYLVNNLRQEKNLKDALAMPGVMPTLQFSDQYIWRPVKTAAFMIENSSQRNPNNVPFNLSNVLGPHWFSGDRWAEAWKESNDKSLGNAITNSVIQPYYSEDELDEMRRDSSWYQFASFGSEVAVAWYADPGVIALKGLGGASRISKNALPLNENSATAIAMRQGLQRESITVRNPVAKKAAEVRVGRIRDAQEHVNAMARQMSLSEFSRLPMFNKRQVGGQGVAHAIWYANKQQSDELIDLAWQMSFGDPKAFAKVQSLASETPEGMAKFAPGTQTLIDAVESTKTRIPQLEREIAELNRVEPKSPFHEWSVHAEADAKQRDLDAAHAALVGYEDYSAFLRSLGGDGGTLPLISQVKANRVPGWSTADRRHNEDRSRFFMDNQFGFAHTVRAIPRSLWIMKSNTATMHDIDSGLMQVSRNFDQYEHQFGYVNPEAREAAFRAYHNAATARDRYKVLYELEDEHLVAAVAQKHGISEELARTIWNKVNSEQNKLRRGILSGRGMVFSSAPSTASRMADPNDHSVSLVSQTDDGMMQIQFMHGKNKHTVTVHESALQERLAPVDLTQTPNYYQPVDVRRFALEVKRHRDLLRELDKGRLADSQAAVMEWTDIIGTKFNGLWKPFQLFRLGWPQRVLMDEALGRATAIHGLTYWVTGPGAEAVASIARNTPAYWHKRFETRRKGEIELGAGPLTRTAKRNPNPFVREAETAAAVHVPRVHAPVLNPTRYDKISEIAATYASWQRRFEKGEAQYRSVMTTLDRDRADTDMSTLPVIQDPGPEPAHPMLKIRRDLQHRRAAAPKSKLLDEGPAVYDPITATRARSGYVVPLPNTALDWVHGENIPEMFTREGLVDTETRQVIARQNGLYWYEKHADLLGSKGYRIMIDAEGVLSVGRWFDSRHRSQANEFAQYVHESYPDAAAIWNLRTGKPDVVVDKNRVSPFMEPVYRQFTQTEAVRRNKGESPAVNVPETFHASSDPDLANQPLLPRSSAPIVNGRFLGPGLYTAIDETFAARWGDFPYVVRSSRSGKRLRVFNADTIITPKELDRLRTWLADNRSQFGFNPIMIDLAWPEVLRILATRVVFSDNSKPDGTWANLFEQSRTQPDFQEALTTYLEQAHGAGVLKQVTHVTTPSQASYVWLHPEDIEIQPLYEKTGRYYQLIDWLDNPGSVETQVPENRMVRMGRRNPMLAQLRTIEAQIRERLPKRTTDDPELRELERRETALMEALGLQFRRDFPDMPKSPLLPDRYVQNDPDAFGRLVDDAFGIDAERAAALRVGEQLDDTAERELVDIEDAWDAFDFEADSVLDRVTRRILRRREMGGGWTTIRSADGQEVHVPNAYEGHSGQVFQALTSSNKVIDYFTEGHGGALSLARRQMAGHKVYNPPEFSKAALKSGTIENKKALAYFRVWADTVNDQIGNSPIWSKMLNGWNDQRITRWLEETPEGAAIRREVMPEGRSAELWVQEHRQKLDYYVPNPILQRKLGKGRLEPSMLRQHVHNDDLPDIYGPDLEVLDKRRGVGRFLSDTADNLWRSLGTVPIDMLSRHPFAKAVYDAKMRALVRSTDSKWLTPEHVERLKQQAHQFTLNEVRRTLFDLSDQTNFTDALRFMAPFWGAQQEAIVKWLRIIADRPETVMRFFNTQRAAYQNFVVVDREGNEVKTPLRKGGLFDLGVYNPEDRVVLQIPDAVRRGPLGKALETVGTIGIPLGSANTVLQGEFPLFPGPGPLLTVPADKFLRAVSDTYGTQLSDPESEEFADQVYRWLFPVGRPSGGARGILEQISPGWTRRVLSATSPEDDQARANLTMHVARELIFDYQQKHPNATQDEINKAITPEEIESAANWLWMLRVVSGAVSPVQTQFRPKNQMLLDLAHKYQREGGPDWWERFIEDHGTMAALYAQSSSTSFAPPTVSGAKSQSELRGKGLLSKYPKWASAMIAPDAWNDEFSYDVYKSQFDINYGPGDPRTVRKVLSAPERLDAAQVRVGWHEFRQIDATIQAEMFARGLTSLQQKGAEDLNFVKQAFIADLTSRNKKWREDYDTLARDIYSRVDELEQWAFRKEFDKRPDIQGVRQYLMLRDMAAEELDANAFRGGSRSLQAQENVVLRQWFYGQVGALIQDNPAFGEFYSRYLSTDDLSRGGGGF